MEAHAVSGNAGARVTVGILPVFGTTSGNAMPPTSGMTRLRQHYATRLCKSNDRGHNLNNGGANNGGKFIGVEGFQAPLIPSTCSHAAFRFEESMVAAGYTLTIFQHAGEPRNAQEPRVWDLSNTAYLMPKNFDVFSKRGGPEAKGGSEATMTEAVINGPEATRIMTQANKQDNIHAMLQLPGVTNLGSIYPGLASEPPNSMRLGWHSAQ
ncbi:hypothetical protein GGX14DRAFT_406857 [Mycena pura]|uniref:Uncharacterized protein n=1 Tax=Mycena pura TaxID=153505 RepID=A0AAD6UPR5_9AGAR|nr:hypothetical protein GGX14DRAFT_406857 [Mycena pura]